MQHSKNQIDREGGNLVLFPADHKSPSQLLTTPGEKAEFAWHLGATNPRERRRLIQLAAA
jgi:hypothetical protein